MLSALAALSALTAWFLPQLTRAYSELLSIVTGIQTESLVGTGSLFFRPFFVTFIVVLGAFTVGPVRSRLRMVAAGLILFVSVMLVLDCALAWATLLGGSPPLSLLGSAMSSFAGMVLVTWLMFRRFRLPPGIRVWAHRPRPLRQRLARAAVLLGTAAAVWWPLDAWAGGTADGSAVPVIGRIGSVPLFVMALTILLAVAQLVRIAWRLRRRSTVTPVSVAFLVPAHNEAAGIEECIQSLDAAAERYPGPCRAYIVDNASSDDTAGVAAAALARCRRLRGRVLSCPTPGKARALNVGLRHAEERVLVRIDADTVVEPSLLVRLLPHFRDDSVGAVGGLALPKRTSSWLGTLRTMEVLYGVGFLRLAQGAVEGLMVVPGMLAAYRRRLLVQLGGFAEGINGEDADITVRIGRSGYRVVTDPQIRAYTETPQTFGHLREQRLRWTRGLFHVAARHASAIWMAQGLRGVWFLPMAILNGGRRAMALPAFVYVVAMLSLSRGAFELSGQAMALGGAVVGLHMVLMVPILLLYRELPKASAVPGYLVFHAFRLYVCLETVLTLPVRSGPRSCNQRARSVATRRPGEAWSFGSRTT